MGGTSPIPASQFRPTPPSLRQRIALSFGIFFSAVVFYAVYYRAYSLLRLEYSHGPASINTICDTIPGNFSCWTTLARALEETGGDGRPAWRRALSINPRDASALTQAALAAEMAGDAAAAEELLLQAEAYNRLWLPRWSLVNFYYRHARWPEFWRWTRAALERSYGDRAALFRLCRQAGARTPYLFASVFPPNRDGLYVNYLWFTLNERDPAEIVPAADVFLTHMTARERHDAFTRQSLTATVEMLLGLQMPDAEAALELWSRLSREALIPYAPPTAAQPLTNSGLITPFLHQGFDWRQPAHEGVDSLAGHPGGSARFRLSGRQAEVLQLLSQWVPLAPGRRYRFRFEFEARQLGPGVAWRLISARDGQNHLGAPRFLTESGGWQSVALTTEAAPRGALASLALTATRQEGQVRPEGELWIRNLRWEALPE